MISRILEDKELGDTRYLTRQEELDIFHALKDKPSEKPTAEQIVIKAYKKYVAKIALSYHYNDRTLFDDLLQAGLMGLIKAMDNYKPSFDTRFITYATSWVKKYISKTVLDESLHMKQSIKILEIKNNYYKKEEELTNKLGRTVSMDEVAREIGIDVLELSLILNATNKEISLTEENDNNNLIDYVVVSSEQLFTFDTKEMLNDGIKDLDDLEKKVISYRYGYTDKIFHTLKETADHLDISLNKAQGIEIKAIKKLKKHVG